MNLTLISAAFYFRRGFRNVVTENKLIFINTCRNYATPLFNIRQHKLIGDEGESYRRWVTIKY